MMPNIVKLRNIDTTKEEGQLLIAAIGLLKKSRPDQSHEEIIKRLQELKTTIFENDNPGRNF